jgi:HEPN domain-containing protein
MHDPTAESQRWLRQADNDLAFARYALDGEFFHQVCFIAQQGAEKALKAVHFAGGARSVLGHSVVGLLGRLEGTRPAFAALKDLAAELDLFYVPTRYPNGLLEGVPHEVFTRAQAERALRAAETILAAARRELEAG